MYLASWPDAYAAPDLGNGVQGMRVSLARHRRFQILEGFVHFREGEFGIDVARREGRVYWTDILIHGAVALARQRRLKANNWLTITRDSLKSAACKKPVRGHTRPR
jgi:hypothetical protein